MNDNTLQRARTARFLEPDSATARLHAQASQMIPGATSRLHYRFKPYPIYARSGRGCRLTDVDGDERIDCLNNMTALIHGHADPDVNAAIVAQALGDGSLFQIVPTDRPLANYRDVPQDAAAFDWLDRLHLELLRSGAIISHRGLSCVSSPMGEPEVDEVLAAFEQAVAEARS